MNVLIFLVPTAIVVAGVFVGLFIWATKKGQFDDLETPAHKMLLDDEKVSKENN
jgi:cbb3-type cytochrome oxidase maturation protein